MPYNIKYTLTIAQVIAKLTKPDANFEERCELRMGPLLESPGVQMLRTSEGVSNVSSGNPGRGATYRRLLFLRYR